MGLRARQQGFEQVADKIFDAMDRLDIDAHAVKCSDVKFVQFR